MKRWLWTQVSDIGPSARSAHAMAYDEVRDRVVLFGGRTHGVSEPDARPSDTWEWDGESWVQVEDVGPPGRGHFAMAYDSARQRVVLFGGLTRESLVNDTWEWDGYAWTQVEDSGPPPMGGHAMAYDKGRGYVLLYKDSTWAWNGTVWTQLTEVGPPTKNGVAAYDDGRGSVILGADRLLVEPPQPSPPSTTWKWDGASWKPASDMGPGYYVSTACMAFDGKRLVLFVSAARETWEWDGRHWVQRQDIGPSKRSFSAMVGDRARERCVLFGGTDVGVGDTWVLSVKEV